MPDITPNLEIKKPKGNENVTRDSFNENWDIIDQNAAKKADLNAHSANEENPHNVTAEQIGASKQTDFSTHEAEDATETQKGHVELATAAEAAAGTDKTKAVHPAGLKAELNKKSDTEHVHSNATTSTAGFMTASEKSKLAGIESGATADQSASEIFSAVTSKDGSGSGLDADKLDGKHASEFATSGHGHSDATASADGFMTKEAMAKLNGIESGATADQTASEILSLLKTVDSNSSGLNADTLDGVHASGFVKTSNGIQLRISGTSLQYYYGGAWKDVGVVTTRPRGVFYYVLGTMDTWYTALSLSGEGVVNRISIATHIYSSYLQVKVTLDGVPYTYMNSTNYRMPCAGWGDNNNADERLDLLLGGVKFSSSLKIETRHVTSSSSQSVYVDYALV